ncbi:MULTISPECIES: hypothetical protein [unclassified Frankia]|uniref:hypothetical protein n=2 Tax=Frankia TaxID=1854 RepID=UPI0006DCFD1D|nr:MULTISPECIES: hypothetical protein [unclassified Frankia]KQC35387.1 hypothetical protein UK82_26670 [Frankia sp. ACN1ag]
MDRLRWGALTGRAGGIAGEAVGFPRVLRGDDGARETNHLAGQVNPLGGLVTDRHDINIEDHPPLAPAGDAEPLPWSGMSGAVLFACADPTGPGPVWLATAVIVVDTPGFGEGRLTAVPVRRLLDDPTFRNLIADDGGPVGWESVELAGLLTPPTVTVPRTPAQLLRADAEIVDLHGRESLLAEFTDWCAGEADSAVRLLVGPGGQGKTRFARALTARLREAGWLAGLVDPEGAHLAGRLAGSTRPVLLVVDYAETHASLTNTLLKTLGTRTSRTPVRLLLVARGGGDWWDDLTRQHDLAENGQTISLPPVEATGATGGSHRPRPDHPVHRRGREVRPPARRPRSRSRLGRPGTPRPSRQTGQFWAGISPDRLAEHFLARHLTGPTGNPDLAEQALTGASAGQTYQALTVLNRAAPAHPDLDPHAEAQTIENERAAL